MGKKSRARAGATSAAGAARAATAGSVDIHEYLTILREMCPTAMSTDYDGLPPDAQKSMLAALKDYIHSRYIELEMSVMVRHLLAGMQMLGLTGHRPPSRQTANCGLARLLRREFPMTAAAADHIAELRRLLTSWGLEQPDFVTLVAHQQAVAHHRKMQMEVRNGKYSQMTTTVNRKDLASGRGAIDWAVLQPITRDRLQLFNAAKGKVLEGQIITPPSCSAGMYTILRDASGQLVRIALYNQTPGGKSAMNSWSYLAQKFPEGTRIAIAEPYYKVSADGARMVRVDSPSEVRILPGTRSIPPAHAQPSRSSQAALSRAAEAARQLLTDREPDAALQSALDALRAPHNHSVELACTLLNNRAQALLRAGCAAAALRDAAAVLTVDSQQPKAWLRYAAALRALNAPTFAERAAAVSSHAGIGTTTADQFETKASGWGEAVQLAVVSDLVRQAVCAPPPHAPEVPMSDMSAADQKDRGNARYQAGLFGEAVEWYTRGLHAVRGVDEMAEVLSLAAEASLGCGSRHTAAAAAAACIRVVHVDGGTHKAMATASKVLARALLGLGEHETCRELLSGGAGVEAFLRGSDRRTLLQDASVLERLNSDCPDITTLSRLSRGNAPDVITHAKLAAVPGKGRGLVATRDLAPHIVVIVNPALVSAKYTASKPEGFVLSRNDKNLLTPAQTALSAKAVHIAAREPLAATTLLGLDDNDPLAAQRRKVPLVPLRDMQQLLSPRVLPLLPSAAEFFPSGEREHVSATFVDRVCHVNAHGNSELKKKESDAGLFPVVSLLNHSSNSNCECAIVGALLASSGQRGVPAVQAGQAEEEVMVVVTSRAVAAGEELTVQYHADRKVVKQHWGL